MSYASIKGEFIEYFKNKILIVNSDDPTVFGMLNMKVKLLPSVLIHQLQKSVTKPCWCGREIRINETITGSGIYSCECGIKKTKTRLSCKGY